MSYGHAGRNPCHLGLRALPTAEVTALVVAVLFAEEDGVGFLDRQQPLFPRLGRIREILGKKAVSVGQWFPT